MSKPVVNSNLSAAVYGGDHDWKAGDEVLANGALVTITDVQGPVIFFQPAVPLDENRNVVLKVR